MNKKTLEMILSQFDSAGLDYESTDYISFTALGKANGSTRFNLIFDYKNKNNATMSRPLDIKNPQIAIKMFSILLWGRRAEENEKNDILEQLLTDKDGKKESGW